MTYEVEGQLSDYGVAPHMGIPGAEQTFFVTLDQDTGRERTFFGSGLQDALLDNEIGPSKGDFILLQNNGVNVDPPYNDSNPGPASWKVSSSNRYPYHAHRRGVYDPDPFNPNRASEVVMPQLDGEEEDLTASNASPSMFPTVMDERDKINVEKYAKSFRELKQGDPLFEISQMYFIQTGHHNGQPAVIFKNRQTDKPSFMMKTHALGMADEVPTYEDVHNALKVSQAKWGNLLSIEGPPAFMEMVNQVIKAESLPIRNIAEKEKPQDFTWEKKNMHRQQEAFQLAEEREKTRQFSDMLKMQLKMNTYRGKPPKKTKLPKVFR